MPLKLKVKNNNNELALEIIEYITNSDGTSFFRVKSQDEIGINIEYVPIKNSKWDKERFDLYIFANPYLYAENDVFEVFESTIKERLGWIFPITILESNENDFVDTKNLNNYKFIAYEKLLEKNIIINEKENDLDYYKLSEIFHESSIICLISKDATNKIENFNFDNYILSFYTYNYLILDKIPKARSLDDKSDFVQVMRNERKRVTLKKSNFDINSNEFTLSLFSNEHLLQSDSYLVRFILMYQIIEYFISVEFDIQFALCLEEYSNKATSKNDLKENINNLSKERILIRNVINRIDINQNIKDSYIEECNFLFEEINHKTKKDSLPDKIYDLRNIIVHRLRDLTSKKESLEKIIEIFERLIVELLINYKYEGVQIEILEDESDDSLVFVKQKTSVLTHKNDTNIKSNNENHDAPIKLNWLSKIFNLHK